MTHRSSATEEDCDRARELLERRWPRTRFDVVLEPLDSDGRRWSIAMRWEDGPTADEVSDTVDEGGHTAPIRTCREGSARTLALGVLLDYEAAAQGLLNIYRLLTAEVRGTLRSIHKTPTSTSILLDRSHPWERHADRHQAELAQTLALLLDDATRKLGHRRIQMALAQQLVDLGGLSALPVVHDQLTGESHDDGRRQ